MTTVYLLNEILNSLSKFPINTSESKISYDLEKNLVIVRNNELNKFNFKEQDLIQANLISSEIASLSSAIHCNDRSAIKRYNQLEKKITKKFDGYLYIYVKQWGLSVKALYFYKNYDYKKAFNCTLECIALNELLIRKGITSLLFRCIEQNKNLSRIYIAMENYEDGLSLKGNALAYLLTGDPKNLFGSVFYDPAMWSTNPDIREGYAFEYFLALVFNLMKINISVSEKEPIFERYFYSYTFDLNSTNRKLIAEWIKLKHKFYNKNYNEFLKLLLGYLYCKKPQRCDILKISLIQDFKFLLKKYKLNTVGNDNKIKFYLDHNIKGNDYAKHILTSVELL